VGNFSTQLSPIDMSARQKFNKETSELAGIYRMFDAAGAQYTFFPATHEIFSKKTPYFRT
jgi:hypothetical protein